MVSEVLVVIRRLASEGMTMAIVSHEMQFVRSVSTRIFFMNEGVIYEEGTPEQIFEHPQRPATIAFINRIRTLEFTLADKHFDLYGMFGKVGVFCSKYGLGKDTLNNLQHVVEEVLYEVMPFCGPVTLTLDYSEKDYTLALDFVQEGCSESILDKLSEDFIPLVMIKGMSTSIGEPIPGRIHVEM
jgi:polar amino acid transport system ATP-binding protein